MKRFLLFTLFLLFSILLNSQNFQIIRQDSYGGYDYEELKCILKSNEGGYLIGASSLSEPSGNKTAPCYGFTFSSARSDFCGNFRKSVNELAKQFQSPHF
ncbi:MAG: hypothetical protein ACOX0V_04065 [Bacteroidales bacterium]